MAIYLIRHAHAGSRASWPGDDYQRPLSERGEHQAEHLLKVFGDEPIGRVWSSPARRCIETVEPLAAHLELPVKAVALLGEGADPLVAIAFMLEHASRHPALCSHGDLIPKVIRRLITAGMRTSDANISQKGSAWVLQADRGGITRGRYLAPPPARG